MPASHPIKVISLKLPLNIANPTGNVRIDSVLVTIKGHIKLFHVVTNVKIERVAITGTANGNAILKKLKKYYIHQFLQILPNL